MSTPSDMVVKTYRTKGDLMKAVYTEEELAKIDPAIPMEYWEDHPTFNHVMNYNDNTTFGTLEDMFKVADQRGIKLRNV